MKLNNKGITLVEIIISIALISIVLVFIFSMLIQVNNENAENEVKSSYLINQAAYIKQIEEDFLDYKLKLIEKCDGSNKPSISGITNNYCLHFKYDNETTTTTDDIEAYLFLYQRTKSDSTEKETALSYYRDENHANNFKQTVILEDYVWPNTSDNTFWVSPRSSTLTTACTAYSAKLPIIGPDGNDYSINLSYANC